MRPQSPVVHGYADLLSRFYLPLFYTQTRDGRWHPEACVKAIGYAVALMNEELHGRNWRRRGVVGVHWVGAVERQRNWNAHSHNVLGHDEIDLCRHDGGAFRFRMQERFEQEWGFARLVVAQSLDHVRNYLAKYVCKEGEIYFSKDLERLGQQRNLGG